MLSQPKMGTNISVTLYMQHWNPEMHRGSNMKKYLKVMLQKKSTVTTSSIYTMYFCQFY